MVNSEVWEKRFEVGSPEILSEDQIRELATILGQPLQDAVAREVAAEVELLIPLARSIAADDQRKPSKASASRQTKTLLKAVDESLSRAARLAPSARLALGRTLAKMLGTEAGGADILSQGQLDELAPVLGVPSADDRTREVAAEIGRLIPLARAMAANEEAMPSKAEASRSIKPLQGALAHSVSRAGRLAPGARVALGRTLAKMLRELPQLQPSVLGMSATPQVADFAFDRAKLYCHAVEATPSCRTARPAARTLLRLLRESPPVSRREIVETYRMVDSRRVEVGVLQYTMNALVSLDAACRGFQPRGRQRPSGWLGLLVGMLAATWEMNGIAPAFHTWDVKKDGYVGAFRELVSFAARMIRPGIRVPDGAIKKGLAVRREAYARPARRGEGPPPRPRT